MKDNYVLGVDSSTSATKVIAFNARGKTIAEGTRSYPVYTEHPGWVEQCAEDWWEALKDSCQQVVSHPDIDIKKITGLE